MNNPENTNSNPDTTQATGWEEVAAMARRGQGLPPVEMKNESVDYMLEHPEEGERFGAALERVELAANISEEDRSFAKQMRKNLKKEVEELIDELNDSKDEGAVGAVRRAGMILTAPLQALGITGQALSDTLKVRHSLKTLDEDLETIRPHMTPQAFAPEQH